MRSIIRMLTGAAVAVAVAVAVANGQAQKPAPGQQAPDASLQQRVAILKREIQSLKSELATLRAQIQRTGSSQAPVASGNGSRTQGSLPSQAEVQGCVDSSRREGNGLPGGRIREVQFGAIATSQGGMMELGMGAPKGTPMFPVKFKLFNDEFEWGIWMFKDSFGKWTCVRS